MAVITIPFNYSEITHPQIVPICIADTDANGNPVRAEWIEKGVGCLWTEHDHSLEE